MITAGALEGGDLMILEPGRAVIGTSEARTQEPAARQLAGWLAEDGWEVRVEPIPERFVHIDVLFAVLAERLAAACTEVALGRLRELATRPGLRVDRGARRRMPSSSAPTRSPSATSACSRPPEPTP